MFFISLFPSLFQLVGLKIIQTHIIILEFHFAYMIYGHLLIVSAYNECKNPIHELMDGGMPGRRGLERSRLVKCSS